MPEDLRVEVILERQKNLEQALRRLDRFRDWEIERYLGDEGAQWVVERGLIYCERCMRRDG